MSEPLSTESVATCRPGTVVRYTPDQSRHDPRWCREGMGIADDRGVLLDTYWGSGNDSHRLLPVEVATVEVLFHLDDYDELDRYSRGTPDLWATYHRDDRQRVTSQHGLQSRWFIRKGASPDLHTKIANAEARVRDAEAAVRTAERDLEWAQSDLAALRTSPGRTTPGGAS